MTDKLETIKQACWKANPEINNEYSVCSQCGGLGYRDYEGDLECFLCEGTKCFKGRPIRLADVLLAIREKHRKDFNSASDFSPYQGYQGMMDALYQEKWWNLLKDSLEDQSPETIDFLYELLN